jgi:hypothetical protein
LEESPRKGQIQQRQAQQESRFADQKDIAEQELIGILENIKHPMKDLMHAKEEMQLQLGNLDMSNSKRSLEQAQTPGSNSDFQHKYDGSELRTLRTPVNESDKQFHSRAQGYPSPQMGSEERRNHDFRLSGKAGDNSNNHNFVMNNNYTFIRSSHPSNDIYFFNRERLAKQAKQVQKSLEDYQRTPAGNRKKP